MKTEAPKTSPSNSIITVLTEQRNGEAMQEASEKLRDCINAVDATGKDATLTIKFTFSPSRASAIIVSDDIKTKLPEPEKANSIFFPNEDGGLQRNDPHQKEMDLRVVPGTAADKEQKRNAVNQ